ncbi:unnamed protein product [Leptidea sinapis]|uniref:MYND-type domain-containing protein n=1 Tax=Leptidea sinapis TaxID=189913 RepID=A0A5E4QC66_9NEOP|nr:unnamed protein product [Leptidea sinapis]
MTTVVKLRGVNRTNTKKSWPYDQYYTGERDAKYRKNGYGENNWSGAKSLESYSGCFTRNSMHGRGEYRWRIRGEAGGLFCNNIRFGPGVQSDAKMNNDVGLWRGSQLVRLAWSPVSPSVIPDFMATPLGRNFVEAMRTLLTASERQIGETNSAIDLLKKYGADPKMAVDKWNKLYPKNCTDHNSPLCPVEFFEFNYYNKIYKILETNTHLNSKNIQDIFENLETPETERYYAWNNSNEMINMFTHSFQNEYQRDSDEVDIYSILSGARHHFRRPGVDEINSRTLLLTSYLGYTSNVAELVNSNKACANVMDSQGNSPLMYATSGDQVNVIRFLVEAGANVDNFNDSCCTALGVALIRYMCAYKDISNNILLQTFLPPPEVPIPPPQAVEWNINRELTSQNITGSLHKNSSKTKNISSRKIKSLMSLKDKSPKKVDAPTKLLEETDSFDSVSEEMDIYDKALKEYTIIVNNLLIGPAPTNLAAYAFQVNDMIRDIENMEDEQKKNTDKLPKKTISKAKDTAKPSKDNICTSKDIIDCVSMSSAERIRLDMLNKIKQTIFELLINGADPRLVRCPHSALFMAILSNSPDIITALVEHGADVNEVYRQSMNYSPLDIAISREFTHENFNVVKVLLECGADADRRVPYSDNSDLNGVIGVGPTLLHAVVARNLETDIEEEVRYQLVDLLLDNNCNPAAQFLGRSAIDFAMSKSIDILEVFIKSSKTNLNCIINDQNQNILVKMFCLQYFKSINGSQRLYTLTNLLLYGADPLLPCKSGDEAYANIFVFATKTKNDPTKAIALSDDKEDYKQAIDLVKECARLLHIRWIQGGLVKELVATINKFKHRHWNLILNEWKKKKCIGLWVTPHRCLEIWKILGTTKNQIYKDMTVLKHLLCIVTFLAWRYFDPDKRDLNLGSKVTAVVKGLIEKDVRHMLNQYFGNSKYAMQDLCWKRSYVQPETMEAKNKFNVCFECALPLEDDYILCGVCKLVSFCSLDCMRVNIDRVSCHPCSDDLSKRYFPESKPLVVDILKP